MKRVLFIAVMLLSAIGFCAECEKPVQSPTDQLKGAKQSSSANKQVEQTCSPDETLANNGKQLIAEFQQIIMLLNKKLPDWNSSRQLENKQREIIRAFVASLGSSLKYSPNKYNAPTLNSKFRPLPLLWLQQNRIAYLRVDGFNSEVLFQFRQIHDILVANYRLTGMIIDLRNCRSFDYKNGVACLKQLTAVYKTKTPTKVHLAVLIGPRTLGVAEYFIHQLKKATKAVIIGMKSAGQPFEYEHEKLTGGGYLLLPRMPENIRDKAVFTEQIPTIKIINSIQGDYKLQKKKPDLTVKYAGELLIAIKATSGIPSGF